MNGRGVNLLDTDDSTSDLVPVADLLIPNASRLSPAVKRAIIVEKGNGTPNKIIALKFDIAESTVGTVWKEFASTTSDIRRISEFGPDEFKTKIRAKAVNAIENGLDCDRDPYRQGALGVQVMKGIGEFKSDHDSGVARVNIMINNVPPEWKERYLSATTTPTVTTP